MGPLYLELTDYVFPLLSLSMFVFIAGIASSENISNFSRVIVIVDLIYINNSHLIGNIIEGEQVIIIDFIKNPKIVSE